MATNNILTDAVITKRSMAVLHNQLGFVKGINREYSKEFGVTGGKIGSSINVRKPNRYAVQQGPTITPQGTTETTTPLTLNRQWVVPMSFSSSELTLHIDEFDKRYITPAISKLASQIDLDCYAAAITGSYKDGVAVGGGAGPINTTIGTPGITPGTSGGTAVGLLQYNSPAYYLNAGMILDKQVAARDGRRSMCIDPAANASSAAALFSIFNPTKEVSDTYRNGLLGNTGGFDWVMDQNVYTHTAGTRAISGEITVSSTWAAGPNLILTAGTAVPTIAAGDTFTVAGCYSVNPETQQSTGLLQQFVVTAGVTMSGATSVAISPTPIVAGAGIVNGNVTVAPTAAAAVVWTTGAASTVSPQNLAFHADAFTLGTADLEIPSGVGFGARESMDGISMRVLRDYNINTDFTICRIDVLGGFATLRPELAVRIAG